MTTETTPSSSTTGVLDSIDREATVENAPVTDDGEPSTDRNMSVDDGPSSDETEPQDDNREAAKYRHRAKAAEAERDRLAERLQVVQRAEVERMAAAHLADGGDFWRDGAQLADLLNEDGDVDHEKVEEAAKALVAAHGHWRKMSPAAPPASTVTSNGKIYGSEEPPPSWSEVLTKSGREQLQNRQS